MIHTSASVKIAVAKKSKNIMSVIHWGTRIGLLLSKQKRQDKTIEVLLTVIKGILAHTQVN